MKIMWRAALRTLLLDEHGQFSMTIVVDGFWYDLDVSRLVRSFAAILLVFAVSAVPLVADWCAATCEAGHSRATAGEPSCHHTASASARVGEVPTPCGHNHQPLVVDAATIAAGTARAALALAIPVNIHSVAQSASCAVGLRVDRQPTQSPPVALALSSVLRI